MTSKLLDILGAVVVFVVVTLALQACNEDKKAAPRAGTAAAQSPVAGAIAKEMEKPIADITSAARAAVKKAPQVAPETDTIQDAAADLTVLRKRLESVTANLTTAEKESAELRQRAHDAEIEAEGLKAELDKTRKEKNNILSWGLRGLVLGGVVGFGLLLFVLKIPPLAFAALATAIAALVTDVLLEVVYEYRYWITGGLGLLLLAVAVWAVVINWQDIRRLIAGSELYKKALPDEASKERVNTELDKLQPKRLKTFIAAVRTDLKKKAAAA